MELVLFFQIPMLITFANYYRCCVLCSGCSNTRGGNKCDWIQCVSCSKWLHEYSSAENLHRAKCQMSLQTATSTVWANPSDTMVFLLIRGYAFYSNLKSVSFPLTIYIVFIRQKSTSDIFHNSVWHLPQAIG
jgi:hypothetical protein